MEQRSRVFWHCIGGTQWSITDVDVSATARHSATPKFQSESIRFGGGTNAILDYDAKDVLVERAQVRVQEVLQSMNLAIVPGSSFRAYPRWSPVLGTNSEWGLDLQGVVEVQLNGPGILRVSSTVVRSPSSSPLQQAFGEQPILAMRA